jgi:hypothetical protein
MNLNEQESTPTGQFALACERMNEFARTLRESSRFETVRTGADIRYYKNGWRLEKWVEAELNKDQGLWAAWWLELGPHERGWVIESHLAVSPDIFFAGLEDRTATAPQELREQLTAAVDDLKLALDQNMPFAEEVRKRMRKGPASQ